MIRGECLCGGIAFEVAGPLSDASLCHCSRCRRATGSAFGAYAAAPASALRWTRGEDLLRDYEQSPQVTRRFCGRCGSLLVTLHALEPGLVHVSLGCLDDGSGVTPGYHQFTGSKADWHAIADGLPRHAAWPEEV